MKQTKRLKLSRWQTLEHYFVVILFLFISCFPLFSLFEIYITKTYDGVRSANELITAALPMVVLAIVLYFIQKRRLRFREIRIEYTDQEFKEALQRTASEYKWNIKRHNTNVCRAYRSSDWTGSWGEMITIIKDKDRVLLNSICDPNQWSSITSYGWNKRNINIFLKNLVDVKADVPVQERFEKPEKEWSLKRIVIRIFAYPFCFFLIILGGYMIVSPVNPVTPLAGLGAMTVAGIYLYSDVKMIMTNKRRK